MAITCYEWNNQTYDKYGNAITIPAGYSEVSRRRYNVTQYNDVKFYFIQLNITNLYLIENKTYIPYLSYDGDCPEDGSWHTAYRNRETVSTLEVINCSGHWFKDPIENNAPFNAALKINGNYYIMHTGNISNVPMENYFTVQVTDQDDIDYLAGIESNTKTLTLSVIRSYTSPAVQWNSAAYSGNRPYEVYSAGIARFNFFENNIEAGSYDYIGDLPENIMSTSLTYYPVDVVEFDVLAPINFPYDTDSANAQSSFTLSANEYVKYNGANYFNINDVAQQPVGNAQPVVSLPLQKAKVWTHSKKALCYHDLDNKEYYFDDLGVDQTCFNPDGFNVEKRRQQYVMPATIMENKLYYKKSNTWYYQPLNAANASVEGTVEADATKCWQAEEWAEEYGTTLVECYVKTLPSTLYLLDDLTDKVYVASDLGTPLTYVCNNGVLFDAFYPMYKVAFTDTPTQVGHAVKYIKDSNGVLQKTTEAIIKTYSTLSAANADILNIDDGQAILIKDSGLYQKQNNTLVAVLSKKTLADPYKVGDIRFVYDRNQVDSDWLLCDGSSFNKADYPALYAALGNSTTLPNCTDRCLMPLLSNDETYLRTFNAAKFAQHKHNVTETPHTHTTQHVNYSHNHMFPKLTTVNYQYAGYWYTYQTKPTPVNGQYGKATPYSFEFDNGSTISSSENITSESYGSSVDNDTHINEASIWVYIKAR